MPKPFNMSAIVELGIQTLNSTAPLLASPEGGLEPTERGQDPSGGEAGSGGSLGVAVDDPVLRPMTVFHPTLLTVFLLHLAGVVVIGNSAVITAVARFRCLQRPPNLALVSLAAADLLQGLVTLPTYTAWALRPALFQDVAPCYLALLPSLLVFTASELSLMLVTVEQYAAIIWPLRHHALSRGRRTMRLGIVAVWLVSLVVTLLSLMAMDPSFPICSFHTVFNIHFLAAAVVLGIFVPFLLMVVIYSHILARLVVTSTDPSPEQEQKRMRRVSNVSQGRLLTFRQRYIKFVRTLVLVFGCFLLAWLPFSIVVMMRIFCARCSLAMAMDMTLLAVFTKSASNPIIYALCQPKFRMAFRQLVACRCRRDHVRHALYMEALGERPSK